MGSQGHKEAAFPLDHIGNPKATITCVRQGETVRPTELAGHAGTGSCPLLSLGKWRKLRTNQTRKFICL